jgi:hypothetical protein
MTRFARVIAAYSIRGFSVRAVAVAPALLAVGGGCSAPDTSSHGFWDPIDSGSGSAPDVGITYDDTGTPTPPSSSGSGGGGIVLGGPPHDAGSSSGSGNDAATDATSNRETGGGPVPEAGPPPVPDGSACKGLGCSAKATTTFCKAPFTEWNCPGKYDLNALNAAGCISTPANFQRFCCPPSFCQ